MTDISLPGLLGAFLGTGIAALAYRPLVALVVRSLQGRDASAGEREAESRGPEMPLLLRAVLVADIALFAGVGYWIGSRLG